MRLFKEIGGNVTGKVKQKRSRDRKRKKALSELSLRELHT